MTDDLGPLRRAMSDLAEHGGSTDLYERSLRRSRQMQRRATVATGAAAMVAVFAIGGAIAFTTAGRPDPSVPVATASADPVVTTSPSAATSPAPSLSPSLSLSPSPSPSPSTDPPASATSRPPSGTPAGETPRYPDCPSAKTLERLADLPEGWRYVPSSIECWRNWATADPEGPEQGDGFSLFQYKSGTGWRYHSDGSGFHCADLGITSGNPPFCQMGN